MVQEKERVFSASQLLAIWEQRHARLDTSLYNAETNQFLH